MRKGLKRGLSIVAAAGAAFAAILLFPGILFAHSATYGAFDIQSDRPISPAMAAVAADAERRLKTSDLYRPGERFRVFVCNEPWRLLLFSRSTGVGGTTDPVTRNIFIREADIAANRVIVGGSEIADAGSRPLSYFIAHEAGHVLASRRFGIVASLRAPKWLSDGLADHIGKGGDFDMAENRARLLAGDPIMGEEYSRTGLYRRYHLMVAALIREHGRTAAQLYAAPPPEAVALAAARGDKSRQRGR